MTLVQEFEEPISGFFDHSPKRTFYWSIQGKPARDAKGEYVRVGSFSANCWFCVSVGKTEKQTLSNARRRLLHRAKIAGKKCKFWYEED